MTIALPLAASPRLQTYDDLVQAVQDWLKNPSLADYVPTFISLAEAHFRRTILHVDREYTATYPASDSITLPTDMLQVRSVYLGTDPKVALGQMSPDALRTFWSSNYAGSPRNYALIAGSLILGPRPDSDYDIVITYLRTLTPLSETNSSNWLLEKNPDIYLFGALVHAELYGWNDERLPLLKSALDEMIADLNAQGVRQRNGGAMRLRSYVVE